MEISSLFIVGNKIDSLSKRTENLFSEAGFSIKKNDLLKITHAIGDDKYILENVGKCIIGIDFEYNTNLIEYLNAYELIPQS